MDRENFKRAQSKERVHNKQQETSDLCLWKTPWDLRVRRCLGLQGNQHAGAWFLGLLRLKQPRFSFARLLAHGPRPFLLQGSALPPQIPHSSFWQVLTAPTKPTVYFHDQQAFLSPPATLKALACHVPIYIGLLHWPAERQAQGCAQICRHLKRSTGGWVKLAKVHGTLL